MRTLHLNVQMLNIYKTLDKRPTKMFQKNIL